MGSDHVHNPILRQAACFEECGQGIAVSPDGKRDNQRASFNIMRYLTRRTHLGVILAVFEQDCRSS